MRAFNAEMQGSRRKAGFYGLDLYSLYASAAEVIQTLQEIDPTAAQTAGSRFGLLTPWQSDPSAYGRSALSGRYRAAEDPVVKNLLELLRQRVHRARAEGDPVLDAVNTPQLMQEGDRYYRSMYYGSLAAWNHRDEHMFDTLRRLLEASGPQSRAVVWGHNAHLGDASATEMGREGERNLGQLCRQQFGELAYLVGFGTDHGTVAASTEWDGPMQVMQLPPAHPNSYERLCHDTLTPAFMLPLRHPRRDEVREALMKSHFERAIGTIYRPEAEMRSHYFEAMLPQQFDEYVWFDQTHAVRPLTPALPRAPLDSRSE
jgi:erythromycin esterase-like protein